MYVGMYIYMLSALIMRCLIIHRSENYARHLQVRYHRLLANLSCRGWHSTQPHLSYILRDSITRNANADDIGSLY